MVSSTDSDPRTLAASLEPVLAEACGGRLSSITWFRTDWQRGGAATGTAEFDAGDGTWPVVVKMPVVPRELVWIRRLQGGDAPVVPRLFAGDSSLSGYDLAWVVIERFEHGPLGLHWHDDHVPRIAEAAARFHAATAPFAVDQAARREPWPKLLKEAQTALRINNVSGLAAWRRALKKLRSRLPALIEQWEARPVEWVHGDLHPANAMSRVAPDSGPVSLIDFAEVRAGHWVEDAVYLERLMWARPERLEQANPVKAIAAARRAGGMAARADDARLAMIRRALLAGTAPAFLRSEGDPRHIEACRDRLAKALDGLG